MAEVEDLQPENLPQRKKRKRKKKKCKENEEENVEEIARSPEDFSHVPIRKHQFEYLDHTADIYLHSWGDTLQEAMEQMAICMFGYMCELHEVEIRGKLAFPSESAAERPAAHDMKSFLYNYMDELLYLFSTEDYFLAREVVITRLDIENFKIEGFMYGEPMDKSKHEQGTEIKAITYNSMEIQNHDENSESEKTGWELHVLVDI